MVIVDRSYNPCNRFAAYAGVLTSKKTPKISYGSDYIIQTRGIFFVFLQGARETGKVEKVIICSIFIQLLIIFYLYHIMRTINGPRSNSFVKTFFFLFKWTKLCPREFS